MPTGRPFKKPEFAPRPDDREKVEILASGRMSEDRIAKVFGIDPKTLRKHFAEELSNGMARRDAQMLQAQWKAGAVDGNQAAQKAWLARADLAPQPAEAQPAEPKPEKLGKKQQELLEAAAGAEGTDWADILNPVSATQQ